MLNLDSAAALAGLDSSNYLGVIDSYAAQLDAGWRLAAGLPLPPNAERADLVLLAAVGDAALAADVARHCVLSALVFRSCSGRMACCPPLWDRGRSWSLSRPATT